MLTIQNTIMLNTNNNKKLRHKRNAVQKPAILNGHPIFRETVPITKPTLPSFSIFESRYREVFRTGMITNAKYVKELEQKIALYLNVKNAIAVSSCTSGLILTLKALNLKGEIIVPSFTFHATVHAAIWNNLKPIFVDCNPETFNIDAKEVKKAITRHTSGILTAHIFGNPCDIHALERVARKNKIHLIFDAAHGFGSRYKGQKIGRFGVAEVFSLSPTKLLTAGEGGIVTTNDSALARKIRCGRTYGDPGTYDCEFSGLSARMNEFNALLGIESLRILERNVLQRNKKAEIYKKHLSEIPGITFQKIKDGNRSSFKDFSILIDENKLGLSRDQLYDALNAENIMVKKYFDPPVHKQKAFSCYYKKEYDKNLKRTLAISHNILSLPMYSHISETAIKKICFAIMEIHFSHKDIKSKNIRLKK